MITFETHDGRTQAFDARRDFVAAIRRINCPRTNKATYFAKLAYTQSEVQFDSLPKAKAWIKATIRFA